MHGKRLLMALILIPVLFLYIIYLPKVFFLVLIMAISAIAQYEFYAMFGLPRKFSFIGIAAGMLLFYMTFRGGGITDDFFVSALIVFSVVRLFAIRSADGSYRDFSLMLIGLLYVPLLMSYQVKMREFGALWIIFIDCCVWAADSAAYYAGKTLGKKKLYEAISPNKTMAGAYGSIVGATLVSIGFNQLFLHSITLLQATIIGGIIGFVTIIGDLVESMLKRDAGVKDSSAILPGHGGILDKIDGFVFATPIVYWILTRVIMI